MSRYVRTLGRQWEGMGLQCQTLNHPLVGTCEKAHRVGNEVLTVQRNLAMQLQVALHFILKEGHWKPLGVRMHPHLPLDVATATHCSTNFARPQWRGKASIILPSGPGKRSTRHVALLEPSKFMKTNVNSTLMVSRNQKTRCQITSTPPAYTDMLSDAHV